MIVCDFCIQYQEDGKCGFGLSIPKHMSCREYNPGLEKFCSDPKDFVSSGQLIQMAAYFGMKGMELKKVKLMAVREEKRLKVSLTQAPTLSTGYEAGEA
jgi:hypothetical protein